MLQIFGLEVKESECLEDRSMKPNMIGLCK